MRRRKHLLAFCLLAALVAGPAHAAVEVKFVDPEHFTDTGAQYDSKTAKARLDELARFLVELGTRYLRPDQNLAIEVLDVDLAGQVEWWHRNTYDLRVMRDVTWPRIKLHYTLAQNGRTVAEAEETLRDPYYQWQVNLQHTNDPLRYEKAMLEDWFRARFGQSAAAQR